MMSNLSDDTELFDRIGKKKRKNLMLSRELVGVLARVTDDGRESAVVERAVWQYLVDEYGQDEIREAVEDVQTALDDTERLSESKPYTLPA